MGIDFNKVFRGLANGGKVIVLGVPRGVGKDIITTYHTIEFVNGKPTEILNCRGIDVYLCVN